MTSRKKLEKRMEKFGIKSVKNVESINSLNFAFTPGISEPHVNKKKREEHRRSMSLGAR